MRYGARWSCGSAFREKQHLPLFTRMGIGQWQFQPTVRNLSLQIGTALFRIQPPLPFFTVVLGTDRFHLKLL